MATDIVDGALSVGAFPATYTGQGTKIGNVRKMGDVSNHQWYNVTSGGNAIQFNCGFTPRKVRVINVTDGLIWEWMYGMPAANAIKTALTGPTIAQDTGSAFTISSESGNGVSTVTLSATAAGSAKNLCVEIVG